LLETSLELLEWGIRIPYNAFGCRKIVFGYPRRAFGYVGYKAWAAEAEGIRIPKDGIRMLKMVSGC